MKTKFDGAQYRDKKRTLINFNIKKKVYLKLVSRHGYNLQLHLNKFSYSRNLHGSFTCQNLHIYIHKQTHICICICVGTGTCGRLNETELQIFSYVSPD